MKIYNDPISRLSKGLEQDEIDQVVSLMDNKGFKILRKLIEKRMESRKDSVFMQKITRDNIDIVSEVKGALEESKFIFRLPENIYKLKKNDNDTN